MAYPDPNDVVQRFTGTLDTSTSAPLASALKIAIADYSGHLQGAANLGAALDLLDVLIAGGEGVYLGFSDDGVSWHETPVPADTYVRFAVATTRPDDNDVAWTIGVNFSGPRGPFLIRQYINATSEPGVPDWRLLRSGDGCTGSVDRLEHYDCCAGGRREHLLRPVSGEPGNRVRDHNPYLVCRTRGGRYRATRHSGRNAGRAVRRPAEWLWDYLR